MAASNADIAALVRARTGEPAVLAQIAASSCGYDLSVSGIRWLKHARVSNRAIAALIQKCGAGSSVPTDPETVRFSAFRPGVYFDDSGGNGTPQLLVPALVAASLPRGAGTYLLPGKSRLTLPDESSTILSVVARPRFWIVIDAVRREGAARESSSTPNGGPENLALVRLVAKGGKRQLEVGSMVNGMLVDGIDSGSYLPIAATARTPWLTVVVSVKDLAAGEYALIAKDAPNVFRLYDFSIRSAVSSP